MLQPSEYLCSSALDPLQQVHVLLMYEAPELDVVVQMGSHQSGVEGQNPLPRPAGYAAFDAAQDTAGFLGCECTLPGHVELLVNQHTQALLRAALNPFSAQPVFMLGIASTHVQVLVLGLVELHEVCKGPPLKPAKVPLGGIPSLQNVNTLVFEPWRQTNTNCGLNFFSCAFIKSIFKMPVLKLLPTCIYCRNYAAL